MSIDFKAIKNVARNSLRPGYARLMAPLALRRVRPHRRDASWREGLDWARDRAEPLDDFASAIDGAAWDEAQEFGDQLAGSDLAKTADTEHPFGGADYRLLFFLIRHLQPAEVVETGVAAGYSSAAILEAMRRNGHGSLHSSDLPYFRMSDPEKFIGSVVPPSLRSRWDLQIRGDSNNLALFAAKLDHIDLFHYDSDKTYLGRQSALEALGSRVDETTVVVFDDIQDNYHFRDWVEATGRSFHIFEFWRKFVGVVGL